MKTLLAVVMLFGAATFAGAQDRLADQLRKGIVQEEVNQNLTKAIEAYQAIVAQFDEERKTAASALFRLAECSRKAGKREQALAAYQRIVREFADQAALVESSRQQLTTAFGVPSAVVAPRERTTGGVEASRDRARESRDRLKAALEDQLVAYERRIKAGVVSRESTEYLKLRQQLEQVKQQLASTAASQVSPESLKLSQQLEQFSRERPAGSLEATKLDLELLEKRLADAQKKVEVGVLAPLDYQQLQTQYLMAKQRYQQQLSEREAIKSAEHEAQLMMQRMVKSVEAEIALIQERLTTIAKSAPPGVILSQSDPELLQLRRDLLSLQRKLDELRSGLKR